MQMPDTLPEWGWDVLPKWEQQVLQSLGHALTEVGYQTRIKYPEIRIIDDKFEFDDLWYGIDVWRPRRWFSPFSWFGDLKVIASICCLGNILFVRAETREYQFDLFDPTSIDKLLLLIK